MQKKSTKKAKPKESNEKEIGEVSTFFTHVGVIAIKLSGALSVGDKIHVRGIQQISPRKFQACRLKEEKSRKLRKASMSA